MNLDPVNDTFHFEHPVHGRGKDLGWRAVVGTRRIRLQLDLEPDLFPGRLLHEPHRFTQSRHPGSVHGELIREEFGVGAVRVEPAHVKARQFLEGQSPDGVFPVVFEALGQRTFRQGLATRGQELTAFVASNIRIEHRIVGDQDLVLLGEDHVHVNPVRAGAEGRLESREGVLGREGPGPAVGIDLDASGGLRRRRNLKQRESGHD